jgi:hypothetical protein
MLSLRATFPPVIAHPKSFVIAPTEIACLLRFLQRHRKEELYPVEKTAIMGWHRFERHRWSQRRGSEAAQVALI